MATTDLDEAAALAIEIGDQLGGAIPRAATAQDGDDWLCSRGHDSAGIGGSPLWMNAPAMRVALSVAPPTVTQAGHGFVSTPRAAAYVADTGGGSPGWTAATTALSSADPGAVVIAVDGDTITLARPGQYVPGVDVGEGTLWLQADGSLGATAPTAPDVKLIVMGYGEGAAGFSVRVQTEGVP